VNRMLQGYGYDFILKPIIIFVLSIIFLRIAGKKAVSEMNSFDLLFVLVLGTVVAEPLVTKQLGRAMLYAGSIVIVYLLYSWASLNNKLRWLLVASPTVLIRGGDIDEKGLRKVRMTTGELISELRTKGYTKVSDVEMALLEDMGKFSVIPKSYARPLQPSDLQMSPSPAFIPIPVIMDGQIIDHNLKFLNKDRDWLNLQLQTNQLSTDENNLAKITLATIDQNGTIFVDRSDIMDHDQGAYNYKPGNQN
jgi:uncharacterized membrane protein YcaP (DUF421 family)